MTPGQGVKIPRVSGPKTQNRSNVVTNAIKTLTSIIEKESSDKWLEPSNREAGQRKGPGHWLTRTSPTPWCMTVLLGEKIHFSLHKQRAPQLCEKWGAPRRSQGYPMHENSNTVVISLSKGKIWTMELSSEKLYRYLKSGSYSF